MRITQILQFTVLTDVDVNGSQNSESLLLLDNEMLNCIFIVIILSCQRILWRLTGFTNLFILINNNHSILNMIAASFVPRDRRGIRDHNGHLISIRDVPALGTSLFVVSVYLHVHRGGGAPEAGKDILQSAYLQYRSFQYYKNIYIH